jgi:gluconolactonase
VNPDGSLSNGKVFFDMTSAPGEDALDGMQIDEEGNLYVSRPGGAVNHSSEGKHLGTIGGPEHPHNMAWGTKTAKPCIYALKRVYPDKAECDGYSAASRTEGAREALAKTDRSMSF